jgi:hypothetical protein
VEASGVPHLIAAPARQVRAGSMCRKAESVGVSNVPMFPRCRPHVAVADDWRAAQPNDTDRPILGVLSWFTIRWKMIFFVTTVRAVFPLPSASGLESERALSVERVLHYGRPSATAFRAISRALGGECMVLVPDYDPC